MPETPESVKAAEPAQPVVEDNRPGRARRRAGGGAQGPVEPRSGAASAAGARGRAGRAAQGEAQPQKPKQPRKAKQARKPAQAQAAQPAKDEQPAKAPQPAKDVQPSRGQVEESPKGAADPRRTCASWWPRPGRWRGTFRAWQARACPLSHLQAARPGLLAVQVVRGRSRGHCGRAAQRQAARRRAGLGARDPHHFPCRRLPAFVEERRARRLGEPVLAERVFAQTEVLAGLAPCSVSGGGLRTGHVGRPSPAVSRESCNAPTTRPMAASRMATSSPSSSTSCGRQPGGRPSKEARTIRRRRSRSTRRRCRTRWAAA